MKNFNYQSELQRIIEDQQLVEVRFDDDTEVFKVGYVLNANEKYITVAEIDTKSTLDGVCMYRTDSIRSIKFETEYIKKLLENVKESVYKQAKNDVREMKDFTFAEFISCFAGKETYLEVVDDTGASASGKILANNDEALTIKEFDDENKLTATMLIKFSCVSRIAVDVPWVNAIAEK